MSETGAGPVLAGEVQQWVAGRWRTVLTAAGTPVTDHRSVPHGDPSALFEHLRRARSYPTRPRDGFSF